MDIIGAILSPSFLVRNIGLISLILAGVLLIMFEKKVLHNFVFYVADYVREGTAKRLGQVKFSKIISESLATVIFIFYVYIGVELIADYIISPILQRMQGIITIWAIILFLLISYMINNHSILSKFFE